MINPWMKKNPLMSMWLSALNRSANTARAHALVQTKRQSTAMTRKAYEDTLRLWSDPWALASKSRKRK